MMVKMQIMKTAKHNLCLFLIQNVFLNIACIILRFLVLKVAKKLIKALRLTLINTEGYPRLKKGNLDL